MTQHPHKRKRAQRTKEKSEMRRLSSSMCVDVWAKRVRVHCSWRWCSCVWQRGIGLFQRATCTLMQLSLACFSFTPLLHYIFIRQATRHEFPCPLLQTLLRCIDAFIPIVTALINSFSSAADELEYYKNLARKNEDELLETRAMLEDFQLSSRELEEELEKEIDSTERRYNEIRIRNEAMKQEVEDWKVTRTIPDMPDDDNEQERAGHQTATWLFTFRVLRRSSSWPCDVNIDNDSILVNYSHFVFIFSC